MNGGVIPASFRSRGCARLVGERTIIPPMGEGRLIALGENAGAGIGLPTRGLS